MTEIEPIYANSLEKERAESLEQQNEDYLKHKKSEEKALEHVTSGLLSISILLAFIDNHLGYQWLLANSSILLMWLIGKAAEVDNFFWNELVAYVVGFAVTTFLFGLSLGFIYVTNKFGNTPTDSISAAASTFTSSTSLDITTLLAFAIFSGLGFILRCGIRAYYEYSDKT